MQVGARFDSAAMAAAAFDDNLGGTGGSFGGVSFGDSDGTAGGGFSSGDDAGSALRNASNDDLASAMDISDDSDF